MKHTLGTAAKVVGVSKSTIYRAVKSGKLSALRNTEGEYEIDPAELHRVYEPVTERSTNDDMERGATLSEASDETMLAFMREQVLQAQAKAEAVELELEQTRDELQDTTKRLQEHRDAARSLMSPEQFDEQLEAAVNTEKQKAEAQSREWEKSLAARQAEIQLAKAEAAEIAERLKLEAEERAKAEKLARALQGRGLISRLLNRKPDILV